MHVAQEGGINSMVDECNQCLLPGNKGRRCRCRVMAEGLEKLPTAAGKRVVMLEWLTQGHAKSPPPGFAIAACGGLEKESEVLLESWAGALRTKVDKAVGKAAVAAPEELADEQGQARRRGHVRRLAER